MAYKELLKDARWQKRRLRELERAGWACEWCASDQALACHHWCYEGKPWEAPDGTVSVLCEVCAPIADRVRVLCRRYVGLMLASPSAGLLDDPVGALSGLEQVAREGRFLAWLEAATLALPSGDSWPEWVNR